MLNEVYKYFWRSFGSIEDLVRVFDRFPKNLLKLMNACSTIGGTRPDVTERIKISKNEIPKSIFNLHWIDSITPLQYR